MLAAAIEAAEPAEAPAPAPPPAAPPVEYFGRAGTVVLGEIVGARVLTPMPVGTPGAFGLGMVSTGWFSFGSTRSGNMNVKGFAAEPSFDVFVANGVSVGAIVGGGVTSFSADPGAPSLEYWHFTAMPRVGDSIDLTKEIALWPRFAAGVTLSEVSGQGGVGTMLRATFDVPFVFRIARHVALQAGPQIGYFNQISGPPDVRGFSGGVSAGLSLLL
jgi:hypothetical protein